MAWVSHSVGVLSEGVHSFLDLISAAVSFFSVREAGKPADAGHPFGHGKIETLSSLFESLLLAVAAALIFYEGFEHFSRPQVVSHQELAIAVILISLGVSYFVFRHNSSAAEETDSSALEVNSIHFFSDVIASLGVLVALIILKFTGWLWIDPAIAFAVAIYILIVSLKQVKGAVLELTDTQLPPEELEKIQSLLNRFEGRLIEAHDLRTRKSGATRHIDFHLVVCGHMSVEESHAVCDEIELELNQNFSQVSVNIHVEPCEKERTQCQAACPIHFKAQKLKN